MNVLSVVLTVAGVCWILARRMAGQQVELRKLLVLPGVLTVLGVTQLQHVHGMDATAAAFVVGGVIVSAAIGAWRGTTVHLAERDGVLWMRYRPLTVGLWILNLALKGALVPVEHVLAPDSGAAANHAIMLSLGVGILAETAVVILRALGRPGGVVWSRGKDGEPDRPAPAFDAARKRMATRDW